jgi:hypothetical protein
VHLSGHCMQREVKGLELLRVSWGHITHVLAANSDLELHNCISHTVEFKKKILFQLLWYSPW